MASIALDRFQIVSELERTVVPPRRCRLGLCIVIVRRLITLLEGSVSLESEVGSGSNFRAWLPLDTGTRDAPPPLAD